MSKSGDRRLSIALRGIAQDIERQLTTTAGERVLFSLHIWSDGRGQYVSNAKREDVATALEELLARWRAGMPDIPEHERQ